MYINNVENTKIRKLPFFRGTKSFVVSVSESGDGPWKEIKSGKLEDPRQAIVGQSLNPQESEIFHIDRVVAHYVKFSCTSYYGSGCALQYIEVFGDDQTTDGNYQQTVSPIKQYCNFG